MIMQRLVSTLEIALRCAYCGRWLKETEAYYLVYTCSDCHYHEMKQKSFKIE